MPHKKHMKYLIWNIYSISDWNNSSPQKLMVRHMISGWVFFFAPVLVCKCHISELVPWIASNFRAVVYKTNNGKIEAFIPGKRCLINQLCRFKFRRNNDDYEKKKSFIKKALVDVGGWMVCNCKDAKCWDTTPKYNELARFHFSARHFFFSRSRLHFLYHFNVFHFLGSALCCRGCECRPRASNMLDKFFRH